MARIDHDAFIIATVRDGSMTSARRYRATEVEHAIWQIEYTRRNTGADVNVTIIPRNDGEEVPEIDIKRLQKAAHRRL